MPTEYTCWVVGAGASTEPQFADLHDPQVYVVLTDLQGNFRQQWFYVAEAMRREILAVAQAAISTGRQARAVVDPPEEPPKGGPPPTPKCYELDIVVGLPVIGPGPKQETAEERRRREEEEHREREEELQRRREEEQRRREEEQRTREEEQRRREEEERRREEEEREERR